MTGLDATLRGRYERAITQARGRLEADLTDQAEGRFGLYPHGRVDPEDALRLDASGLADRRDLIAVIQHLRAGGEGAAEASRRLVREAAFTHLNRLVAIRVAEATGLLPPSLADGRASRGYREILEVAPLLAADPTGGYWAYLRLCGDELAADAPVLFDPRNPLLALAPSPTAVDEVTSLVADPDLADAWTADDTFGWTYQFFNTRDERREMREAGAPRTTRELAVRNQFFTPRYVVDFLVHNTLGRRLLEANPDSPLRDRLDLLVDPPKSAGEPLELEEVGILDPAVGSGHFLLGCYDLLEQAWEAAGVAPAEAAARILPTIWGVDIDPRCAQVASAALLLRARRRAAHADLPRPHIVTARALPTAASVWERVRADLERDRRALVDSLAAALEDAPLLGSLLKVEQRLASDIRETVLEAGADDTLFAAAGVADDAFGRAEADVLAAIRRVGDEATATAAERVFAAEAGDAIGFVEAMRHRYDVVLMNPPFGEPIPATKDYLKAAYPWIPTKDTNLLAGFVGRGLELCRAGGYLGAITSRVGMFLTTFERWRTEVLLNHRLVTLADLGHRVMEQALVEAAAYVVSADAATSEAEATFIRLLRDADRSMALGDAITADRSGRHDERVYRVRISDFDAIPGSPLAYWMAPSIRRLFTDHPRLEGAGAEVRVGLQTGDDFRFVRAFWEVDPASIGRSREETLRGRRWVPFAKGGEYSPYWSDLHLVLDWAQDGRELRQASGSVIRNDAYYFRSGLTWSRRTASGFGARLLPSGAIFADKGPAILPLDADSQTILGWVTSRVIHAAMHAMVAAGEEVTSGAAAKSYEVGLVQKLPWPGEALRTEVADDVGKLAEQLTQARAEEDRTNETTRRFLLPALLTVADQSLAERVEALVDQRQQGYLSMLEWSRVIEEHLHDALALDNAALAYLDLEIGAHPTSYADVPLDDEGRFAELFATPIDAMIDAVVEERGGSRAIVNRSYVADRRLEVLAHAFERHPMVLAEARQRLGLLPPEEPAVSAQELVSWLVGTALGRWDVRIARDPSQAPPPPVLLDPVPPCSPGMLVGDDGLPCLAPPDGYPLDLPPDRILVDEPGHRWDIEEVVRRAAAVALGDDADALLEDVERVLRGRSLRDYLRRYFFTDHLRRYSKSRRKAPIYWQLSVPSRKWSVWVYASMLSRETLYAVGREAARRQAAGTELLRGLQAEREAGHGGRALATRTADEESLAEELRAFRAEADRVAGLGWEPDLDDGAVLCAAPLVDLFPAWPDAAQQRTNLQRGRYPWATVAKWVEQR